MPSCQSFPMLAEAVFPRFWSFCIRLHHKDMQNSRKGCIKDSALSIHIEVRRNSNLKNRFIKR